VINIHIIILTVKKTCH